MAVTLPGARPAVLGGKPAKRARTTLYRVRCLSVALHPWAELARPRKAEIEGGALTGAAVGPHPAAVTRDDPVHDRQADSGALERLLRMQALKHAEEPVGVAHVEADAVVAHVIDDVGALTQRAHLDARVVPSGAELDGVRQQIDQHLLEQRAIREAVGELSDLHARPPAVARLLETRHALLHDLAQRHAGALEGLAAEAREMQQIVDEPRHAAGPGPDPLQNFLPRLGDTRREFGAEHLAEALDRTQRLAQVVRHGV